MKVIKFKTHIYEWSIKLVIVNGKKDIPAMSKCMKKFGIVKKNIKFNIYHAKKGTIGGTHYYNQNKHMSFVIIYNCKTMNDMTYILCHELRHVTDRILHCMVIDDIEAAACLAGYIAKKVIPKIFKLK